MSDSEHALQTATAVTVRHAALTDIGVRREENQDSFGVLVINGGLAASTQL